MRQVFYGLTFRNSTTHLHRGENDLPAAFISTRKWPPVGRSSFFVAILLSCRAFAIDPTEYLFELHHNQWTTREGAPT
jgi:hypothetical protein